MANRWLDDDDLAKNKGWGEDDCEDFDPNKDYYAQKLQKKETNILQSTERSLRLLEESERVGNAAAVELDRQGEVLRRSEQRVDKIEQDLKQSDRHLRSIKSIWGAFMNKFSKEPPPEQPPAGTEGTSESLSFEKKDEQQNSMPRVTTQDSKNPFLNTQQNNSMNEHEKGGSSSMSASSTMSAVDENLDLMGNSLSRLKNLSLGLKDELDAQDPMLSRLTDKIGRVDGKMNSTNKEMLKIYHS